MIDQTYATVFLDPNWAYNQYGQKHHGGARSHYTLSPIEVIAQFPLPNYLRKDTNILLWATIPKLHMAFRLIESWELTQVTGIIWIKTTPSKGELSKGIGHWGYGVGEILLICRTGKAKAPKYKTGADKPDLLLVGDPNDEVLFYARRANHSRKPLSLFEWVESYLPGPYAEFYARDTRVGWDCYGHETGYHLSENGITRYVDAVESGEVEEIEGGPAQLRRKLWTPRSRSWSGSRSNESNTEGEES